jgi:hypothetical protein
MCLQFRSILAFFPMSCPLLLLLLLLLLLQ